MSVGTSKIWLCQECDAVIYKQPLASGEKVQCANCLYIIAENPRYSFYFPLIFSVAGLVLLVLSCILPLVHMQMFAGTTEHSIVSGILNFVRQSEFIPAALIFFGAIFSPFVYLFLCTMILILLIKGKRKALLIRMIKVFGYVRHWGMLEVYLLGIFIAIIKLNDVASVYPGFGLVTLILLILCQLMILFTVKERILWVALESSAL